MCFFADTPVFHFGTFDFADPANYASDDETVTASQGSSTVYSPTSPATSKRTRVLVFEKPHILEVDEVVKATRACLNYIGKNTLRAVSKRMLAYQRAPNHYFMSNRENPIPVFPEMFPKVVCDEIVEDFNIQKALAVELGQPTLQYPIDESFRIWLACATRLDYFDLNQAKDKKDGYQFDHVPHYMYHPIPEIERTETDIWNLKRISAQVVCFNCGTLTCCGGETNKQDNFHLFRVRHKRACPLINGLRVMSLRELQDMGNTMQEPHRNMRRSYYRSFMKLKSFNELIKNSQVIDRFGDRAVTLALQIMWIANCIRYQLHYTGPPGGPSPEDHLEVIVRDWFENQENVARPCPRYRYGFKRLCSPCMNPACSFFGRCTVKEHYVGNVTHSHSDTMFKHVGAIPTNCFSI